MIAGAGRRDSRATAASTSPRTARRDSSDRRKPPSRASSVRTRGGDPVFHHLDPSRRVEKCLREFLAIGFQSLDLDLELCFGCLAAFEVTAENFELAKALELLYLTSGLRGWLLLADGAGRAD